MYFELDLFAFVNNERSNRSVDGNGYPSHVFTYVSESSLRLPVPNSFVAVLAISKRKYGNLLYILQTFTLHPIIKYLVNIDMVGSSA